MERKLSCPNLCIIVKKEKSFFSREHTKTPNTYVRACSDFTFLAVEYHLPPLPNPN